MDFYKNTNAHSRRGAEFDALDPSIRANPWPYYKSLFEKQGESIYKLPHETNFYLVHRYEDVCRVLRDPGTFSSQIYPDRNIPFFPMMSGEEHSRIRGVVQTLFSPRATRELGDAVNSIASEKTGRLVADGTCDLVEVWASRIPLAVIASLTGHPTEEADLALLRRQATALNIEAFPLGGTGEREILLRTRLTKWRDNLRMTSLALPLFRLALLIGPLGLRELSRYIGNADVPAGSPRQVVSRGDVINRKRDIADLIVRLARILREQSAQQNPDTIFWRFVQSYRDGHISLVEMLMACLIIWVAGYGTVSCLLSSGAYRLAVEPSLFAELKSAPAGIDNFVEELLRYHAPLQRTTRRVTRPTQLGDTVLPADAQLIVLLGCANVDPNQFPTAFEFDHRREQGRSHLAFGQGIHVCLGASLARLQARVAMRQLLAKVRRIQLDATRPPEHIVWRDTGLLGFEKLPVVVEAERTN